MIQRGEITLENVSLVYSAFDLESELAVERPPLESVDLQVVRACNLHCDIAGFGCWGPAHENKPVRPLEDWQRLIDNIHTYNNGLDNLNEQLIFTGGEPLLSDLTVPLVQYGRAIDIGHMTVSSNLIRQGRSEERFAELINNALRPVRDEMAGPVDAVTEECYEKMRPGSTRLHGLEMAVTGLVHAQQAGIDVVGRTVIAGPNREEVPKIVDFVRSKGLVVGDISDHRRDGRQFGAVKNWKYYQVAPFGPAVNEAWHSDWHLDTPTTLGIFFDAALRNQRHGLHSRLQLNQNTNNRYIQVDPDGVAYTIIYDRQGEPHEIVFGNAMDDFAGTMYKYHRHTARSLVIESALEQYAQLHPGSFADPNLRAEVLSSLIANTYDSLPLPDKLTGYDRRQVVPIGNPLERAPAQAPRQMHIDLTSPNDGRRALTGKDWQTTISELSGRGLGSVRLTGAWADSPVRDAILAACHNSGIVVAADIPHDTASLHDLLAQGSIRELVAQAPLSTQWIAERLESASLNILDPETATRLTGIAAILKDVPNVQLALEVPVTPANINRAGNIPGLLRTLGIDPRNIRIELIEQEPLKRGTGPEREIGFVSAALSAAAHTIAANGCRNVTIRSWADQSGAPAVMDASGMVFGKEILETGPVRNLEYGNIAAEGLAAVLNRRARHQIRTDRRRTQIANGALPMGIKSSLLRRAANEPSMTPIKTADILAQRDALAAYYFDVNAHRAARR